MDGSYGIFPETGQLQTEEVDMFGDHFYPPNATRFDTGVQAVNKAGRNYLAGEFDWTQLNGGDDLATWLAHVKDTDGTGDIFWSLFGHDDACCEFVEHDDGESFYYLRQNATNLYTTQGKILIDHAAAITGVKQPVAFPAVACPQFKFPSSLAPPGFPFET